jgi:hypothetical protein
VLFTNREQALTSDLTRMGKLSGREAMDRALLRSVRPDFYDPSTHTFDDITAGARLAQATPIDGLTMPPSLDGAVATFDMQLGAGEGQVYVASPDPDLSSYQQVRWPAQTIVWPLAAEPDPGDPRICLIVALPADVPADLTSRNILLDPVTRAVSPANVYKTSNPEAVIGVVEGVPAAVPVAPAVPAGALALFEVWLPAGAADSSAFLPVRRAWRQIEFPGTSQHGILKGCEVTWDDTLGAPNGLIDGVHRLVIDGELLTFEGGGVSAIMPVDDVLHTPGAAPAGNDAPHYLYLCGGRHSPILTLQLGTNPVPVVLIRSTLAPDALGHPLGTLSIASPPVAFPAAACCYIGICWYAAGSTDIVRTVYTDDWVYAATLHNFVQPDETTDAPGYTAAPMLTRPAASTAMRVRAIAVGAASSVIRVALAGAVASEILLVGPGATTMDDTVTTLAMDNLWYADLVAADSLVIRAVGFNMNVPRLAR